VEQWERKQQKTMQWKRVQWMSGFSFSFSFFLSLAAATAAYDINARHTRLIVLQS
jgi:hypothetical protein